MRGKPEYRGHVMCEDGITPADAGKTSSDGAFLPNVPDHPRGCGENAMLVTSGATEIGSPPRMRGKPSIDEIFNINRRDHPRGCGENFGFMPNFP